MGCCSAWFIAASVLFINSIVKKLLLIVSLVVFSASAIAEQVIELVPLKSQLPQNIIPVIKPLLGEGAAISSMHNQLIIKADKTELAEIKRLIQQLDSPPRRLFIEVSHEASSLKQQSDNQVSGRLSNTEQSRLNVKIKRHKTQNQLDSNQMVRATEGYPALIHYGHIIPTYDYDITFDGDRFRRQRYTDYREATSGFYVVPRIIGNQVSLEILQQRNRYQPGDGSIAVQGSSTFVHGQLGEWIRLGSIGETGDSRGHGLIYQRTTNLQQDQQIYVRVTVAD